MLYKITLAKANLKLYAIKIITPGQNTTSINIVV
jgi:hypothetical protein